MSASFRYSAWEEECAGPCPDGQGESALTSSDHWHRHTWTSTDRVGQIRLDKLGCVWAANRINGPAESHFKVGHIRRRRLIVMSILTILIFRLRRVTNVILMAGLASPEHDEKWGLNPWHVTTELSDLVTRTRTRGAIIHRDKKAEAVEEESGAVLMTPGSSSSLPSSSAAAKSPSAIRTFCWWHKTLNQKCVTLKPLIGPNRFLRPSHWLIIYWLVNKVIRWTFDDEFK